MRSAGLTQEGQREEELRAALEHIKTTALPLPQRLAELRDVVEHETQELRRREAGMPELLLNMPQGLCRYQRARFATSLT